MKKKSVVLFALFVLMCVLSPSLFPGQISVSWFGVGEAWNAAQKVILATVTNKINNRNRFAFTVEKLWEGPSPVSFKGISAMKPGEKRRGTLYTGIPWTDPEVPTVDNRLWGYMSADEIVPGERVLLFPNGPASFWAIPATEQAVRKLDTLAKYGDLDVMLEGATDSRLLEALSDIDLWALAARFLMEKGKLSPYVLLTNRLPCDERSLAFRYVDTLSFSEKRNFFTNCGRQRYLLPDYAQREVLLLLANYYKDLTDSEVAVLIQFLSKLDLSIPENLDQYGYYLALLDSLDIAISELMNSNAESLPGSGELSANLAAYAKNREPFATYENSFESIVGKLPQSERVVLITTLFAAITDTPFADYYLGNCDAFLLNLCLDWALKEPAAQYLPGIASIPLADFKDKAACKETTALMLSAAFLISGAYPETSALADEIRKTASKVGCFGN